MKTFFLFVFLGIGLVGLRAQAPRLVVPVGHTDDITSVAFSPDGKYVLTGSWDNTAKLWDLNGREIQTYSGHANYVTSVAFSPDGKYVLTASLDNTAKLWDLEGKPVRAFHGGSGVESVAFSPDGKYILTGSWNGATKLWDLEGRLIRVFQGNSRVTSVVFSPDGKHVLTCGISATLWSLDGKQMQTFYGGTSSIKSAAFSPDGKYIVTVLLNPGGIGGYHDAAKLWDLQGKQIRVFSSSAGFNNSVVFSPDGQYVVTGGWDATQLWDLNGQKIQAFHKLYSDKVNSVAFSPDGKYILTGSDDGTAILWNLNGQEIRTFQGRTPPIRLVAFLPDSMVMMGSSDNAIRLWDLKGKKIQTFPDHTPFISSYLQALAFSPDGKFVLFNMSNTIRLWNLKGNKIETFLDYLPYNSTLAFSPNGKYVFGNARDNTAKLWNLDGHEIQTFLGGEDAVSSVAFSPDGKYILTGIMLGKTVKLWDLKGREIQTFSFPSYVHSVTFSPDGKYVLAGGSDMSAKLWDLNGHEIQTFHGHKGTVSSAVFSPDGKYILTGSWDNTAKLWELNGQEIRTFQGHKFVVDQVSFSPDGKYILTGSWDRTAKLWDVKTGLELVSLIPVDSTDWIVTAPSGLFDASTGAMKRMHYVQGLEVIDLEQLKDRYYEPGLLAKVMGFAEGGLRPVEELKEVALYPAITKAVITGDRLHVELEARSGGIGKVALLLDEHIELDTNANPGFKTTFDVDLRRFAGHFYPDSINHLSLRTYNHDGWLKSQPYPLDYRPAKAAPTNPLARHEQQLDSINLYALVVGTSHFRGEQLNLRYPDQDATAFAEALRLAGKPLFGKNIEVQLLTTSAEPWPRKAQIAKAMRTIADKADPNDILLIYFSGHGITYPPNSEKGQFYYLTTDIGSDKLDDPAVLAASAIAQDTLQEWIRQVRARKRILILDACNSGRVVERLEPGAKELNSDQRRALEQMKDRSGLFVLAGSAADKSSFEASRYGHGLLTYSLLNNMPVVAAANKQFVQVDKLFSHVREEVPRLAKGIGKVQDPELIGGETYAIGLINESVRIWIPEAKPVFVRTVFMDSQRNKDLLHLSAAVNDYLEQRAGEKDPAIAYWAVDEFSGDHYYLGGQYRQEGETVSGKATLYREDKELATFPFSGEKNALGSLAERMVVAVFGWLNENRE